MTLAEGNGLEVSRVPIVVGVNKAVGMGEEMAVSVGLRPDALMWDRDSFSTEVEKTASHTEPLFHSGQASLAAHLTRRIFTHLEAQGIGPESSWKAMRRH